MKKLIAVCTTIALLATSAIPAVAQTTQPDEKSSIVTASSATIKNMVTVGEDNLTDKESIEMIICLLGIYDDVYGKYLDEEQKAVTQECFSELEKLKNNLDKVLTEEESEQLTALFLASIFTYSEAANQIPIEQQLIDIVEVTKKEAEKLDECDLKDYMNDLSSKDIADMTEEEKFSFGDALMSAISFSRLDMSFTVGDVDMDGKTNSIDALTVLRHSVGMQEFEDYEIFLADTNKDSKITAIDALLIQRYVAGYPLEN